MINCTYPDDLCVLPLDGQMQSRLEIDILKIEMSSSLAHQELGHLDVVIESGQMQGRVAVIFLLVDDPRPRQL